MAERGEDAAQNFGVDEAEQRQAARREEGAEGVAAALEGRETKADRGAEDDPVPDRETAQTPADEEQCQQLRDLLDEPYAEVNERPVLQQPSFEDGGSQDPGYAAVDKGEEDSLSAEGR